MSTQTDKHLKKEPVLNADWKDAPDYLFARKKKEGPGKMIFFAALGTVITVGALGLLSKTSKGSSPHPITQPSAEYSQNWNANSAPVEQMQTRNIATPQADIAWSESVKQQTIERLQNNFNDQNYKPRRDVNTMQAPSRQTYASNTTTKPSKRIVRNTHTSNWTWLGANKKRVSGRFEWVDVNGSIDYSTVCQNYKSGSFIYRDCRKGAKQRFKDMCGKYKPACSAAGGFQP